MHAFSRGLIFFAIFYVVYALGAYRFPRSEISKELARVPSVWLLAPVRWLYWLVLLPMASLFEALLLAFVAFCSGGLLIAVQ